MPKPTGGAAKAAWGVAVVCGTVIAGMLAARWLDRGPAPGGTGDRLPFLLIPFLVSLPTAFFALAREHRRLEDEVRNLRERVEELERVTLGVVAGRPDRPPTPRGDDFSAGASSPAG
jgi:MFS family permease